MGTEASGDHTAALWRDGLALVMGWNVVVQPPLTPGYPRTGQPCIHAHNELA